MILASIVIVWCALAWALTCIVFNSMTAWFVLALVGMTAGAFITITAWICGAQDEARKLALRRRHGLAPKGGTGRGYWYAGSGGG